MVARETYFDFLRGFAILLVVAIHTYPGGDFQSFNGIWDISAREACNVAVPLFLVISGYFIGKKSISNKYEYCNFLKKHIPRVYIPCIIWSIPIIMIGYICHGTLSWKSIIMVLSCSAFGPYYFIALIIQFYMLHPVFQYLCNKGQGKTIHVITGLCVILLNYLIIRRIYRGGFAFRYSRRTLYLLGFILLSGHT